MRIEESVRRLILRQDRRIIPPLEGTLPPEECGGQVESNATVLYSLVRLQQKDAIVRFPAEEKMDLGSNEAQQVMAAVRRI